MPTRADISPSPASGSPQSLRNLVLSPPWMAGAGVLTASHQRDLHELSDGFPAERAISPWMTICDRGRPHAALAGLHPGQGLREKNAAERADRPLCTPALGRLRRNKCQKDPSGTTDYPGIRVIAAILSRKPEHFVHLWQRSSANNTWNLSVDAVGAQETESLSFGRGGARGQLSLGLRCVPRLMAAGRGTVRAGAAALFAERGKIVSSDRARAPAGRGRERRDCDPPRVLCSVTRLAGHQRQPRIRIGATGITRCEFAVGVRVLSLC